MFLIYVITFTRIVYGVDQPQRGTVGRTLVKQQFRRFISGDEGGADTLIFRVGVVIPPTLRMHILSCIVRQP